MIINKGFHTKICSDLDFNGMVVLACYNDQIIAEINYDKGMHNIEIEIVSSIEDFPKRIFPLDGFFNILKEAKELAIKCAKEDELKPYE